MRYLKNTFYLLIWKFKISRIRNCSKPQNTKKFLKINDYEKPTKEKEKGVLEGCLLFSFLSFCWFLINVYSKKFVWSKFGRFFVFWGSELFWIIEILNYAFIWTLRWIWVSELGNYFKWIHFKYLFEMQNAIFHFVF